MWMVTFCKSAGVTCHMSATDNRRTAHGHHISVLGAASVKSLHPCKPASLPIQLGHQAVLLFPLLGFLHERHNARLPLCRNADNKPNKIQTGQFYIEGKVSIKMNKLSNLATPTSSLKVKGILGI